MDNFWITCFYIGFLLSIHPTRGQSEVEVQLITRKYVEKGSDVVMRCVHNIDPNVLYKVAWLKNDADIGKFFEYIADRTPPFRNFSIPGAEIDWSNSNSEQVALKNVDFEAAGLYYCEVTTSTPIYTKPSSDEQINVILPQTGPPRISFNKRHYYVGERLVANCTTSKARPPPHITWLINGKKVDDKYVRQLHPFATSGKNAHRSKSHQHQQGQKIASVNRVDSRKSLRDIAGIRKDEITFENSHHYLHENHRHGGGDSSHIYNPLSQLTNSHEANHKTYDNKFFDTRKHRNSFNRKYRRYVSEGTGTGINSGSSSSSSSGSNGSSPGGLTSSSGGAGGIGTGSNIGPGTRSHRGTISSSQLSIEVSELHISNNGRLEITCLATIPAHVGAGEQFADYKTYSVKVDVEKPETSSLMPPMSGMAALGNASFGISIHRCPVILSTLCLLILKF